jgi:cytochrome c oxidase subunit 2
MKGLSRRQGLRWLAAMAAAAGWPVAGQPAPRTIEIVARRFRYTPNDITVQAGERVVLAVTSQDFEHGLSLPDLKLRIDLVPDRVVRLELPPLRPGRYGFLCDNFCGDDHEDMHGRLVVQDPT